MFDAWVNSNTPRRHDSEASDKPDCQANHNHDGNHTDSRNDDLDDGRSNAVVVVVAAIVVAFTP